MKPLVVPLVALFLLPVAVPGHAEHCNGSIIAVSAGAEALYIDDRSSRTGEINHWIYLESNDMEGLQSGGDHNILQETWEPTIADPCEHPNPDLFIL